MKWLLLAKRVHEAMEADTALSVSATPPHPRIPGSSYQPHEAGHFDGIVLGSSRSRVRMVCLGQRAGGAAQPAGPGAQTMPSRVALSLSGQALINEVNTFLPANLLRNGLFQAG